MIFILPLSLLFCESAKLEETSEATLTFAPTIFEETTVLALVAVDESLPLTPAVKAISRELISRLMLLSARKESDAI